MIEVNELYFTYPGKKEPTVKGVDFKIKKGEIFGFLGPSGAGKSTLQKILIGILKNYKGSVKVFNQDLNQIKSDYYERIGVAFEFPNFYSKFTALENLSFFRSLYCGKTENPNELLSVVGLGEDGNTRFSNFSKGMKMRLNICRALLNDPDIIFLDEPTSGLDPVNSKKIRALILRKKAEGKTVVITTHNMNVAEELCDHVAFIVDGRVMLIDEPNKLKVQKGKKTLRVKYEHKNVTQTKDFPISGLGENRKFLQLLNENEIHTLHSQEASLEDIFIEVTGRKLL
ncbi:ABC transporter ATP-binding protein [Chengkuizengella axinellae]|uniref:ABC transporter ATP-binding protein n=1 Tax=Chengkuizengella axinellae TaxID=3064388 RepID=A0ABT9IVH1_9BACL|nr:ABC transporter ATP-binding protein [Chengkuizengella sp. 2205SS18-9]MDP5273268.1 ABC transporter ATP-binding protein [Chengkuizengella sp. 2205SS18-9]